MRRKIVNISGRKFRRLTAIKFSHKNKWNAYCWLAKCECGNKIIIPKNALISGNTKSCGCLKRDSTIKRNKENKIHGMFGTRFYEIWHGIISRTQNPSAINWNNYGGRGIKMSKEWRESFQNFFDDMYKNYLEHIRKFGEKDTQIDRIDNDGNYCKENCRWATRKEQCSNRRKHYISLN